MQLRDKKILLTGATGGIGQALACALYRHGARLVLAGRNVETLTALAERLQDDHGAISVVALDLGRSDVNSQATAISDAHHDIDVLINCAGLNLFAACDHTEPSAVTRILDVNLSGTILFTQALLPRLLQRKQAAIVNVGSTFGSIGYPGFAVYCASKFGLRGYSEALRRELAATGLKVFYVAPRATATDMNAATVCAMNAELGNAMDTPEQVASEILRAISQERQKLFIGWPEKFFVFMNSLMSGVVDKALFKQLPVIQRFLLQEAKQ